LPGPEWFRCSGSISCLQLARELFQFL